MNRLASPGQLRASFLRWALFLVPLILLLGYLSGEISGSTADNPWFMALEKPGIYPPPATFGIVWTILYAMMGFAFALVCSAWGARGRVAAIIAFIVQFAVNLAWSPIFFAWNDIQMALIVIGVLDLLVIVTVVLFWRVRKLAAWLLLPYLAWVLFATALNWQFLALNPSEGGSQESGAVQTFEF